MCGLFQTSESLYPLSFQGKVVWDKDYAHLGWPANCLFHCKLTVSTTSSLHSFYYHVSYVIYHMYVNIWYICRMYICFVHDIIYIHSLKKYAGRMAKWKLHTKQVLVKIRSDWNFHHSWGKYKLVPPLWKLVWQHLLIHVT